LLPPAFALAERAGIRVLILRAGREAGRESLREDMPVLVVLLAPLECTLCEVPFRGVQPDAAACLLFPLEPFPPAEPVPVCLFGRLLDDA
jgi:hypothetical protein